MDGPTLATIKRLFAFSGNRCAYPNCALPIVEDSGTVTGIVCHIKARSRGGPRYDMKQTNADRHSFQNLVLMCARHSKLIDSDPKTYTVECLQGMKAQVEQQGSIDLSRLDAIKAEAILQDYRSFYISAGGHVMFNSPGSIQGTNVNVRTSGHRVKIMPTEGSVGADVTRRNYVKHLIDRYNDFASKQRDRKQFAFAAIYAHLKKKFGADWLHVPLARFEEMVALLQTRIDRTQLGCINRERGFGTTQASLIINVITPAILAVCDARFVNYGPTEQRGDWI